MRLALVTLAVTGACVPPGPPVVAPAVPVSAVPVPEIAASRWVPAHPTYMALAKTIPDAQETLRAILDSFGGLIAGHDGTAIAAALHAALLIDPFDVKDVADHGIDVAGSVAVFSQDIDPTFVVHLSAPHKLASFFAQLRSGGFTPRVVVVDGVEISTSPIGHDFSISWAIDADWLWVHFTLPGIRDDGGWFAASRHASASWLDDFTWARQLGTAQRLHGVVGVIDLHGLVERVAHLLAGAHPDHPLLACAERVLAVRRIGFASDLDGKHAMGRATIELSPGTGAELAHHMFAPTEGWAGVASRAPLAVQWNLDLAVVTRAVSSCAPGLDDALHALRPFGVRAGRAVIASIDPDAGEGTGAVELEVATTKFFTDQLDRIPLRSHLESNVKFGPYAGKHLSIPFGPKIDYVLTDKLAMAGLGDGVLARAVGRGPGGGGTIAAFDIVPSAMPTAAWRWLLGQAGAPNAPWLAAALEQWHDAHVTISLDRDAMIVEVHGDRR